MTLFKVAVILFKALVILFKALVILFKVSRIDLVQHVDLVQVASLFDAAIANGTRAGDPVAGPRRNAVSRVFNPITILFKVPVDLVQGAPSRRHSPAR
jgi:hypothetical protein